MHEHLDGYGLLNMNGRVYDPMLSRFLSPDPFVQLPGSAMGYNRYAYCLNNPLIYTDPTGYSIWTDNWFTRFMDWVNGNTVGLRQKMVDIGVPDFNVGINSAGNTFHSFGNSGYIYHNQLRANSTEAIMGRTTVTFNEGYIDYRGVNFVNNLGVPWDNVRVASSGGGESADYLLPKLYWHYQFGGGKDFVLDASTLDFSGTTQRELKLTGMKPEDSKGVNLFNSGINSNSLAFGKLTMTYQGGNQFSITSNPFDFDYQSNSSFSRNAGTFIGGAVFGQFYTIPVTPFGIIRDVSGFGGSFDVIFYGTTTIPK